MKWPAIGLIVVQHILTPVAACPRAFPDQACCTSADLLSDKLVNVIVAPTLAETEPLDFYRDLVVLSDMAAESKSPRPESLRILCFGDSLTAGYTTFGTEHYPYGDTLQTELAHLLSLPLSKLQIDINGASGDQVRGSFVRRMKKSLEQAKERPYDYIVILGGTNDLGWGQPPHVIYENLKVVWRHALDSGAKVLALTVIEAASSSGGMIRKRGILNDMIKNHQDDRYYTFDLWNIIRYTGIDDKTRAYIWDDGLHLTQHGYDVMGKAVAARLYELIQETEAAEQPDQQSSGT